MKKLSKKILSILLIIVMLIQMQFITANSIDISDILVHGEYINTTIYFEVKKGSIDDFVFVKENSSYCMFNKMKAGESDSFYFSAEYVSYMCGFLEICYQVFNNQDVQIDFRGVSDDFEYYISFTHEDMTYYTTGKISSGGKKVSVQNKFSRLKELPDGYDYNQDRIGYGNRNLKIDKDIYKIAYGDVKGAILHGTHELKEHGVCYGITSTTAALLQNRSAIESFGVYNLRCIYDNTESNLFNMKAIEFAIYGHVYQYACGRDLNLGKLRELYSAVKDCVNGNGDYVAISLWKGSNILRSNGHTVLATGLKETSDAYIVIIDDSNFYFQTELTIKKDFSSWEYTVDNETFSSGKSYSYKSSDSIITYDMPGSVVYNMGVLASGKSKTISDYANSNQLLVSSTSSITTNENLAEIFTTGDTDEEIINSNKLYWVDEDLHNIEVAAENDATEITVADVNSSVSVVLNSDDNASFYVDDDKNNSVSYSTKSNTNSDIVFTSVDDNGDIVEITLTGTANGDEVVASETEDGIQVTGLNDITVTYETPVGTSETKADVTDGSTVNITVNDDENKVETDWNGKTEKICSCNCHGNAFLQFFHKIITFLRKLFGMTQYQYCDCGKAHW